MRSAKPYPAAVLDTNELVSGTISRHGLPNRVLRAWQRDAFALVTSPDLVAEVADVLARPRIQQRYGLDRAEIDQLLAALSTAQVQPLSLDALPVHCRDAKDDPVLACALGGGADFIVTGDEDLLALDGHPALGRLRIVTPRTFLDLLEEGPRP